MANKFKVMLFSLIGFFAFTSSVFASTYYGIANTVAKIRTGPGTNYTAVANTSLGNTFDLVSETKYPDESLDNKCPNGWYQVMYNNSPHYICGDYLDIHEKVEINDTGIPTTACETAMATKGFPSSYWYGLCSLIEQHPTWNFEALLTDVDFGVAVFAESTCGTTLIDTDNANYKNPACTKDYYGYQTASSSVIAYYLDPRNFFNESNIFMFENQYLTESITDELYINAIKDIYNNRFIITQIPSLPNYIVVAGKANNMSPIAITSRIIQEMGNGKLTSGAYKGQLYSALSGNYTTRYPDKLADDGQSLDNYYNFYNINAYDTSSDITYKALKYAYRQGWGGPNYSMEEARQIAITGGAGFIKRNYLDAGQKTVYLQKFNVIPNNPSSRYLHQYMSNVTAPLSESTTMYKAYKNLNMLDSAFTFYIPVFTNMPKSTALPTNESDKFYDGIGDEVQDIPVENTLSVNNIVTGAGFLYTPESIAKIEPQMEVATLKDKLTSIGGTITIYDANNNEVATGMVGTGYQVKIEASNTETLKVVIYGDTSGDGKINALDLLKVQKHILNSGILKDAYLTAADASKDGQINALDLLKVQKHILGSSKIEQ